MEVKDYAYLLHNNGIRVIPTEENKSPVYGFRWKTDDPEPHFNSCYGIGIACGGDMHFEMLDFDKKVGNIAEIFKNFWEETGCQDLLENGYILPQTTKNGGFHILWRSEKTEGNRKLAMIPFSDPDQPKKKYETFIETRGDGGYFCCYPTPGYQWIGIDEDTIYHPWELKVLSNEMRDYLVSVAVSYNKYVPEVVDHKYKESTSETWAESDGESPGSKYNEDPDAIEECKSLLREAGWTQSKHQAKDWIRPGKNERDGISATFGYVAPNLFYNFSSNSGFEPEKGYKPFYLFTYLKHGGDFYESTKELAERYGMNAEFDVRENLITNEKLTPVGMSEEVMVKSIIDIENYRIDPDEEYDEPPVIMEFSEVSGTQTKMIPVFHEGDFSLLIGPQKAKKSMFISLLSASAIKGSLHDKLYTRLPEGKKKVVVIDTEQGQHYAWKTAKRIKKLAESSNFEYFGLRKVSYAERKEKIEAYIKAHDDIGLVIIDGLVDLVRDPNDFAEAQDLSQWLMELTALKNTHVMGVLHINRGSKEARGFLGLVISQKAETIIELEKHPHDPNTSYVKSKDTRGKSFTTFQIRVNDEGIPYIPRKENEVEEERSFPKASNSNEDTGAPF